MNGYNNLKVWNKAYKLTLKIYSLTKKYPKEETYGLISQMRRSAVSIPSNIAEGAARKHKKEFIQFLYIGLGSLSEAETQIILAERLGYISDTSELYEKISSIKKMLNGLIAHLENKK
ncbi:four helix bundle protein [bacterium]|nr:four helix bundle protein [bacterium]